MKVKAKELREKAPKRIIEAFNKIKLSSKLIIYFNFFNYTGLYFYSNLSAIKMDFQSNNPNMSTSLLNSVSLTFDHIIDDKNTSLHIGSPKMQKQAQSLGSQSDQSRIPPQTTRFLNKT